MSDLSLKERMENHVIVIAVAVAVASAGATAGALIYINSPNQDELNRYRSINMTPEQVKGELSQKDTQIADCKSEAMKLDEFKRLKQSPEELKGALVELEDRKKKEQLRSQKPQRPASCARKVRIIGFEGPEEIAVRFRLDFGNGVSLMFPQRMSYFKTKIILDTGSSVQDIPNCASSARIMAFIGDDVNSAALPQMGREFQEDMNLTPGLGKRFMLSNWSGTTGSNGALYLLYDVIRD